MLRSGLNEGGGSRISERKRDTGRTQVKGGELSVCSIPPAPPRCRRLIISEERGMRGVGGNSHLSVKDSKRRGVFCLFMRTTVALIYLY